MDRTEPATVLTQQKPGPRARRANGESAVLAKIATMPAAYRSMGERLHGIIRVNAPDLTPKIWYGMPGYARGGQDGKCVCFFRGWRNERYMTFGFTDAANLDEGHLWATSFALTGLTPAEEAKIATLVKKAVS